MMRVDGLSTDSLVFRKTIDRIELSDPVVAPVANVPIRQLLNNTRSLYEIIKHLSGEYGLQVLAEETQAMMFRTFWTSGVMAKGAWEGTNTPSEHNFGNDGATPNALFLGPTTALVYGRMIPIPLMKVELPNPPDNGTRDDLLFLESWLQKIDPVSGEGLLDRVLNINDQVVYKDGNLDGEFVAFKEVFANISQHYLSGANVGDIVRIQYQWKIRVATDVDFQNYPHGLGDPNVVSRKGEPFVEIGNGLYADEANAIWAIPLTKITREAGRDIVQAQDVVSIRPPIYMIGIHDQNAVQKRGDSMHGDLHMQNENGIVFGNRFRLVYNEAEDSLDLILI